MNKNIKRQIKEATSTGGSGSVRVPLSPGVRLFNKEQLQPFIVPTSKYDSAELAFDSYDGEMSTPKSKISKIERESRKIAKYVKKHPEQNDEDGGILNNDYNLKENMDDLKKKIKDFLREATDSWVSSGPYTGPIELGLKKWRKQELGPFSEFSKHPVNKTKKQKKLKNNTKKVVGVWEKHPESGYKLPTHDVHTIKEDLGVWFGTKKKPKGSKQPKGPWVNICKKDENGKHPPCGRPEASDKAYPKCRAAGVAGKMTDSQKKSACVQKRKAEKTNPKSGTGNKPKMVSYKPKKKKTNEEILFTRLIESIRNNK